MPSIDEAVRLHRAVAEGVSPLVDVLSSVDPVAARAQVLVAAVLTGIGQAAFADKAKFHAAEVANAETFEMLAEVADVICQRSA